jgi:5'-nucleotidase (lipoprotein e(P4) family)
MHRVMPLLLLFFIACTATTTTPTPAAAPTPAPVAAAAPQCNPGHSILNATLYVQSSAEFRAAARQTFAAARRALDEALADPTRVGATEDANEDPSQPPAVIVDVDETVLDNTAFEARVIRAGMTYDAEMWKAWTAEGAATAIPGALEFLTYAKSKGVAVFYVTNRDEDERTGTRSNLQRLGFPLEERRETLLLRTTTSDKAPRRREVGKVFRILLLVGDDLNDFAPMREASWADRNALIEKMSDWWGTRWFMIPNPMYGSWERAAIGQGGTPCEQLERKIKALQP